MTYDPSKRNGWARGLIHFHTEFSDGGASVQKAAEIARAHGYDFLIVTDHLQDLKLKKGRSLQEYIIACDTASKETGTLVIPGGEIEVDWENPRTGDSSQAHTLAFSIRHLISEFDWTTPGEKPYAGWTDNAGGRGTILAVQQKLMRYGVPPAASHQFQHAYLGSPIHPAEHADYRYDLERIGSSRLLDFFYSGVIDAAHEPEDFALYLSCLDNPSEISPAIYASCDYHYGPETLRELLHQHREEIVARLRQIVVKWRRVIGVPLCWLLRWQPDIALSLFEHLGRRLFALFRTIPPVQFAAEQLSHATYVYLGDSALTEENVIQALWKGQSCVTRGAAEFRDLRPVPSNVPQKVSRVDLYLDLPVTYSVHRPRSVLIYRDGNLVDWIVVPDVRQAITLTWTDPSPPAGIHSYVLYVPSKFLSSPLLVEVS